MYRDPLSMTKLLFFRKMMCRVSIQFTYLHGISGLVITSKITTVLRIIIWVYPRKSVVFVQTALKIHVKTEFVKKVDIRFVYCL